jgi:hypothetical protein
VHLVGSII